MKCKNCGGESEPGARVCQYCGSELEEKEKIYIPVREYIYPPPSADYLQNRLNAEGGKAFVLAFLSLFLGFVIIRTALACLALRSAKNLTQEAQAAGMAVPSTVAVTRILSIISLIFAGACALAFIISMMAGVINQV